MSDLQEYFGVKTERESHPLLRRLAELEKSGELREARLEVRRPRSVLGFEPALMYLHVTGTNGQLLDYEPESWDADLNAALVQRRVRAVDEPNEVTRFALALGEVFDKIETRFGAGFFSSVLVTMVKESPLGNKDAVRSLLPYIPVNEPFVNGRGYEDCRLMIQDALEERWHELTQRLGYAPDEADRIFADAVAYYLDERFTITDRRKMNWL